MLLDEILDPAQLGEAVDAGLVSARSAFGVTVYNYTARTQYSSAWTPVTMACRGLVVSDGGEVAARPFGKFFGWHEPHRPPIPDEAPFVVADKWDGSLGILYTDGDGRRRISTRGSPESEQAAAGTAIWCDRYDGFDFGAGVTALFEIVAPEHRIVVDYGDMRDLVLIAAIDNATGADLPLDGFGWPGPTARQHRFDGLDGLVAAVDGPRPPDGPGEGYVVRFDTGPDAPHLRVKLKWREYVELHKTVTSLTERRVWTAAAVRAGARMGLDSGRIASWLRLDQGAVAAMLDTGDPVAALVEVVPDEHHPWLRDVLAGLDADAGRLTALHLRLAAEAEAASGGTDRGYAEAVRALSAPAGADTSVLFGLRRQKPGALLRVWRALEPAAAGAGRIVSPGTGAVAAADGADR